MKIFGSLRFKSASLSIGAGFWTGLTLCILLLNVPSVLRAQGLSGITGTVTDGAGAVVTDATVIATNNATGVVNRTVTNASGSYVIADAIPGAYTLRVEREGFATRIISGVHVDVSRTTTVNADLKMGSATETVEVVEPAISLETTQPQLGTILETKLVEEVPVIIGGGPGNNGARDRQIDDYLFLAAGVQGGEWSHRINGGLDFQDEIVFNGVPVVQAETQGFQSYINPPFEMVGEIQVITSNFGAQYGLAQGVASYQFASGANAFHGDGFEVIRNTMFDAAGANPGFKNGVKQGAPTIHQNNYGFTFGGPVMFPKIYNGTNKTFFHFSADWFRINQRDTATMTVPTQAMVGGDFSALLGLATPETIYVPENFVSPVGCNATPGNKWPGNVIPTACFSKDSASLLSLIPQPVLPGLSNNASSTIGVLATRQSNWGFSIDHNLTDKQKLHGSFWRDDENLPSCCSNNAHFGNALSGITELPRLGTGLVLTYSNALTSNLVMTEGFSWIGEINNGVNSHENVNFPAVTSGIILPTISFQQNGLPNGPTSWGVGSGYTYSINRKLGVDLDNNWLWSHRRHTFNIGWEVRRAMQDDHECAQCGGSFSFSNRTTADPTNVSGTGNSFASFLLGDADSASRNFAAESKLRNFYVAPYIQDDIKLTSKLTVNAGLRWDIMVPFNELNNNVVYFDPTIANPAAITPGGTQLMGAANKLGTSGYDRADMKLAHFAPRVGFAYSVNKKTVVLSGFSWNYLDGGAFEFGNSKIANQYGNLLTGLFSKNSNNSNMPGYGLWDNNPMPVPALTPFSSANFNGRTGLLNQFGKDPGPYPYSSAWNAGIQRELPHDWFLSASYVGNKAAHLPSMVNPVNQTNPKYLSQFCSSANPNDPNCAMSPASPNGAWTSAMAQADLQAAGMSVCPGGTASAGYYAPYCNFMKDFGANASLAQALLPYPTFGPSESCGGLCNPFDMHGTATYNALQVSVSKRFTGGFSFLANYTLSKTFSNTDSGFAYQNYGSLNGQNQKSEWTVSASDQTHVLNIVPVYELPFGPGRRFLNSGGLLQKNILGGWQMSGAFKYYSGTPLTVYAPQDVYLNGFNRANYNSSVPLHVNYNNYYKGLPVFNTAAFSDPGFAGGNEPRNLASLRAPFSSNENLALAKHFYLGERVSAEARIEFFNVLNRMQVCTPDNGVSDGANHFGIVQPNGSGGSNPCQGNTPRQGQGFVKISF
jgi:hypothetical protein